MSIVVGSLTQTDTYPQYSPGAKYTDPATGKKYEYLLYSSGASASTDAGFVVTNSASSGTTVTNTVAPNKFRGVAQGVVTAGKYAWFLVWGEQADCNKQITRALSSGCDIFASAVSSGTMNGISTGVASLYPIIGYTREATGSTSTTSDVFITGPQGG
jgi:hypothetical protein